MKGIVEENKERFREDRKVEVEQLYKPCPKIQNFFTKEESGEGESIEGSDSDQDEFLPRLEI